MLGEMASCLVMEQQKGPALPSVPYQSRAQGGVARGAPAGGPVVIRRGSFVSAAGPVITTHTAAWFGSHPPTLGKVQKRQERDLLGTGRKITDLVK